MSALAVRGYRALLHLYPRAFREQFASDMVRDLVDAKGEAATRGGWRGELSCVRRAYMDVLVSLARQWSRDTTATIGGLAVLATAALFTAPIFPPLPNIRRPVAAPLSVNELSLILFILGLLFMIAIVIVLTCCVVKPTLRRVARGSSPRRASRSQGL